MKITYEEHVYEVSVDAKVSGDGPDAEAIAELCEAFLKEYSPAMGEPEQALAEALTRLLVGATVEDVKEPEPAGDNEEVVN